MAISYQDAPKIYYRTYPLLQWMEWGKINIHFVCASGYLKPWMMISLLRKTQSVRLKMSFQA